MKILSGSINMPLADAICASLEVKRAEAKIGRFPGGEIEVQICESVRGSDVFVVQSVCASSDGKLSPNDALMQLLILIDAARRASAGRITAVLPYFGYARQDRKDKPHVSISAKLVADLMVAAGVQRVLTLDLHANQIQGFFNIPVDHLYAVNVFGDHLKARDISDLVVVSPDVGGIRMARAYAELLGAPLAIIDKRRLSDRKTTVLNVIGDVDRRNGLIVDDLTSTAGSISDGAAALKERGARDVLAVVVHPVLVEDPNEGISAVQTIESSPLYEVLVSDSIPVAGKVRDGGKIRVLSVAPLLGEAIWRIHNDESVSSLFANTRVEG